MLKRIVFLALGLIALAWISDSASFPVVFGAADKPKLDDKATAEGATIVARLALAQLQKERAETLLKQRQSEWLMFSKAHEIKGWTLAPDPLGYEEIKK